MNLNVSQKNLYLFLSGKISLVVDLIREQNHLTPTEAIEKFYESKTYQDLENEETKLWHLGPVPLYQDYVMKG